MRWQLRQGFLHFLLLALVVVAPHHSHAQLIDIEICGDGIDNMEAHHGDEEDCPTGWVPAKALGGCDKLCPGPDKDWDGYVPLSLGCDPDTEICDCDDEDKFIYPGSGPTTKGCSGGQVRECQADGTFTECAAWACPAGRTCYYFSPDGDNATGDGTIGNPYQDIGKFGYWYDTGVIFPYAKIAPSAGDMYIMRGGTYTNWYAIVNKDLVLWAKANGSAGNNVASRFVNPGANGSLSVSVDWGVIATSPTVEGDIITVTLAYSGGAVTSTAAQVKAAIEAHSGANALVDVELVSDGGSGIVRAISQGRHSYGGTTTKARRYMSSHDNYAGHVFNQRDNVTATEASPITVMSYPGEWATISPNPTLRESRGVSIAIWGSRWWEFKNFSIIGGKGTPIDFSAVGQRSKDITVRNLILSAPAGRDDNYTCLGTHTTEDVTIENVIAYDCYKDANAFQPGVPNNNIFQDFSSFRLSLKHNTMFYSSYSASDALGTIAGNGFKQKHALIDSSVTLKGNVVFNAGQSGMQIAGGNWTVSNHVSVYNGNSLHQGDIGGGSFASGALTDGFITIENSTFVNSGNFSYNPVQRYNWTGSGYEGPSYGATICAYPYDVARMRIRNNIIVSNIANSGQESRQVSSWVYGPDHFFDEERFLSANNTWYNTVSAPTFGLHESNNGDTSCANEARGSLGGSYTWAQWQAIGNDTDSHTTNPVLSADLEPTAEGHEDRGRFAGLVIGEGPEPPPPPPPPLSPPVEGRSFFRRFVR